MPCRVADTHRRRRAKAFIGICPHPIGVGKTLPVGQDEREDPGGQAAGLLHEQALIAAEQVRGFLMGIDQQAYPALG